MQRMQCRLKTQVVNLYRQPAVVDIQILRVGQLVVLCVPGEFTTMAGRRLRQAVHDQVRLQTPH